MADEQKSKNLGMDERALIPLELEQALRGLLKVGPYAPVPQDEPLKDQGNALRDR